MQAFSFGSISRNLFVLVLVAVLPVLAILIYTGIEQRRLSIEDAKQDVFLLTHGMAEIQQTITRSVRQTLSTLSLLPEIQALDSQASSKIFKAVLKENPEFLNIALTDLSGEVLASGKPFKTSINFADRKHVREAIAKRDFAIGEFILIRIGAKRPSFSYACPVFDENNGLIAVLTTTIKLDRLYHFYNTTQLPEKSFVAVTDYQGIRLLYLPPTENTNPIGKPIKADAWEIASKAKGSGQFTGVSSDGVSRIFAFEQIRLSPGDIPYMYVWAGIPQSVVLAPANTLLTRNLLLLLLSTFLSLAISWLIGKKTLLEPINNIVSLTKQFAEGNFNTRSEQPASPDEIGKLAEAFHAMADSLSKSKKTLSESEYRFKEIFNNMGSGVAIYDAVVNGEDFIFKDINPSSTQNINLTVENVIGKSVKDVLPGVIDIGLFDVFQRVWQTNTPEYLPPSHYKDSRLDLWVEHYVFKLPSGEIVAVCDDVTERKQLEEERKKSEEKFRALIDQATDAILVSDMGGNIILANRQASESMGYSNKELLNLSVMDIDPAISQLKDLEMAWQNIVPGKAQIIESLHRRKDGSLFPVEIHIGFIDIDNKTSILGIVRDTTLRKKFEESLRKSKEEWKSTFDAMDEIITIQDKDMRIVRANKAFHDFFQVEPEALNGKYCYEVFRGSNQPCPNCPELASIANQKIHSGEILHENLKKVFHVSSYPILNENGDFEHLVHVAKDITEKKRIQEDLLQSHKMEAVGTLAGGIAHDFNNILSAILGYSEFVKKELPDHSPAQKDIDMIIQSGKRAADLVKQILTFSRKKEHHLQSLNPYPIIKEALQMLRSSLPTTIEIEEYIDKQCGDIVADPTNIHQIVVNLCTNALHAMDQQKGIITVKVYCEYLVAEDVEVYQNVSAGPFFVLAVSDTGHGIDESTSQRIFEPYFTTKAIGKGSGIGLSVIHGIVQDYKGFIRVESVLEKGSTFYVYLPVVQEKRITDKVDQVTMQECDEPLSIGSGRILIVDDERLLVQINKRRLESVGYTVTGITDSEEALEKIRTHPEHFDLLITDQTMPRMSGAELIKEALKIQPDLPVIMSTGHSEIVTEKKALEMGVSKYIIKPIQGNELIDAAQELLGVKK